MLIDLLFTILLISESPNEKIDRFFKAGYKENLEELERFKNRYSIDPSWSKTITERQEYLKMQSTYLGISENNLTKLRGEQYSWPHAGQMEKHITNETNKDFYNFFYSFYYKKYSQMAHLTFTGSGAIGAPFLYDDSENELKEDNFEFLRLSLRIDSIIVVMAVLSELEVILHYGTSARLKKVWAMVSEYSGYTKEVYEMRYSILLP